MSKLSFVSNDNYKIPFKMKLRVLLASGNAVGRIEGFYQLG